MAELLSHQEPVQDVGPFPKQGPSQMQILGAEEEVPPVAARGLPGSLL